MILLVGLLLVAASGSVASGDSWPVAGGDAARTSQSEAAPLRSRPVVAWEFDCEEQVSAEPVVHDGRVLVETKDDGGHRSLWLLDLDSGEPIAKPWKSRSPLATCPSIENGRMMARKGGDKLVGLKLKKGSLTTSWTLEVEGGVWAPVTDGEVVIYVANERLVCHNIVHDKPQVRTAWEVEGRFRGHPAIRDGHVFAVRYDRRGNGNLAAYSLTNGEHLEDAGIGHDKGDVPSREAPVHVVGVPGGFGVRYPRALRSYSVPCFTASVGWDGEELSDHDAPPWTRSLVSDPVSFGGGFLGIMRSDPRNAERSLRHVEESTDEGSLRLANEVTHPALTAPDLDPSVARDVLYLGAAAVDLKKREVLWHLDLKTRGRAIPVHERVLVTTSQGKLVCLAPHRAPSSPTEWPTGEVTDALVALRSGEVLTGDVQFSEARARIGRGTKREPVLRKDVQLVREASGRIVYASGENGLKKGLAVSLDKVFGDALAQLAKDARSTNDLALLERLIQEAQSLDADPKIVATVVKRIERLREKPKRPATDKVQAIKARLDELRAQRPSAWWDARDHLPPTAPIAWRRTLVEWVFELHPEFPPALDALRQEIPEEIRPTGSFDGRQWMRYLKFADRSPTEIVKPSKDAIDDDEKLVSLQTEHWRKDLLGYRSERCLIVSPVDDPARLSYVLAYGELLCDALESIFGVDPAAKRHRAPLQIFLAESRAEYLKISGDIPPDRVANFAGHYSPSEGISRLYLDPADTDDARALATFTHELTHHWLDKRCTAFEVKRDRGDRPGYWLVEGIANLAMSFDIDPIAGTYSLVPNATADLDIIVNAEKSFAWTSFFDASLLDLSVGLEEGVEKVPSSILLGRTRRVTPFRAFYAQAGATSHWLFYADEGKHRARFLELIARWYSGSDLTKSLLDELSMSSEEIAAAVREHAEGALGL